MVAVDNSRDIPSWILLCLSYRLYPIGIPMHAHVGIPMQKYGSLLLVGGLGYESHFSEGVLRRWNAWMHGNDVLFPFMVFRGEAVCWQQRYVAIFVPLVPTTTSSFPTPRNQLPHCISVVLTNFCPTSPLSLSWLQPRVRGHPVLHVLSKWRWPS